MYEYELLCSSKSYVSHRRCLRSCREAHRNRRRSNDNEPKSIPPTTPFQRYAIHSNAEAPCMRKALEISSKGEMRKRASDRDEEDIRINRLYWLIDLKLEINVHDADEMRSVGTSKWIASDEQEEASSFSKNECARQPIKGFHKWDGMGEVSDAEPRIQCERHFMIDRLGAFLIFHFITLFCSSSAHRRLRLLGCW